MSIITISRGSYSRGKEVAEKLARVLNYECVSREIVLETCKEFNIPEIKLVRALHDAPSVLDRFQHGRERFLSYYSYALLKHVQQGNVIYHGLAGQYILKDISHVVKIRIVTDMNIRVREEMARVGITEQEALYQLHKDDHERRKWGLQVHGTDTWDSRLYDMVFHVGQLSIDDVVEMILTAVNKPAFQPTPESQKKLDEMVMCARIQAMLMTSSPEAKIAHHNGTIFVSDLGSNVKSDSSYRNRLKEKILDSVEVNKVVFQEPVRPDSHHINPYHNIC